MAYDGTKLTRMEALKAIMEAQAAKYATKSALSTLQSTVDGIVETGGEANVIETIKVNGTAQTVTSKAVDITVPTYSRATSSDDGLMSSTDKSKLDGMEIATEEEVAALIAEVFG